MSFSPSHLHSHSEEILTDEKLERAFREIEEASERRAREEEEASLQPAALDPAVIALPNMDVAATRKRHRQSISISRIGSYPDVPSELQSMASSAASPVPWAPPPLYRTRTQSTSSLASASSFTSGAASVRHEEENHTTQKETIVGRRNTLTKAVSSAFAKTLTRMRSRGALAEDAAADERVVIGVAVHEATTEAEAEEVENAALREGDVLQNGGGGQIQESSGEPGPSRRMSISIKAEVTAPPKVESRSRSGSINRLRGKLPARIQGNAATVPAPVPASASVGAEVAPGNASNGNAGNGAGEEGTKSPSPSAGSTKQGLGQGRRLSYFAKALAQRLRRRSSREEDKKEKDDKRDDKKEDRKEKEESRSPPALLKTPNSSSANTIAAAAAAAVPLPPSPRKITFAETEAEAPPSATTPAPAPAPTSSSPAAAPDAATSAPVLVPAPAEANPALIPLPSSPIESSFAIPTLRIETELNLNSEADANAQTSINAKDDVQAEPEAVSDQLEDRVEEDRVEEGEGETTR